MKKLLIGFITAIALLIVFVLLAPKSLAFDPFSQTCTGEAANSPVCQQRNKQNSDNTNPVSSSKGIIRTAANILALLGGIAAVIMIIVSGFIYATAGGTPGGQRAGDSPNRAKNARTTLMGAVIGLAVIALAWSIVTFIINRVL